MKVILFGLLACAAACGRDSVAPEGAALAPALALHGRSDASEGSGAGEVVTFEDFAFGVINGQFDWQSLGGMLPVVAGVPCATYDHEIADYAAVVPGQFRDRSFGHRSLRLSNAVTSGCYSDQTFSSRTRNVAGQAGARSQSKDGLTEFALAGAVLQDHFEAEWTLMSAVPDAEQPGLEVVASPARGDDLRMSWVQMADLPDGLAIVFAERSAPAAPGAFQRTTVARGLARQVAHTIKLTMDFLDGPANDIVRVFVDGALRHTGTSWENYYAYDANGAANFGGAPPAVNRMMFRTGSDLHRGVPGDPAPATRGHGFIIDNLRQVTFMVATSKDACKDGGWRELRDATGAPFRNQGDCVSSTRNASHHEDDER